MDNYIAGVRFVTVPRSEPDVYEIRAEWGPNELHCGFTHNPDREPDDQRLHEALEESTPRARGGAIWDAREVGGWMADAACRL